MATRIERMEESLRNYENKIVEIRGKIEKEKQALIAKRGEAEAKLREAKAKFEALYGSLPTMDDAQEDNKNSNDSENALFIN